MDSFHCQGLSGAGVWGKNWRAVWTTFGWPYILVAEFMLSAAGSGDAGQHPWGSTNGGSPEDTWDQDSGRRSRAEGRCGFRLGRVRVLSPGDPGGEMRLGVSP